MDLRWYNGGVNMTKKAKRLSSELNDLLCVFTRGGCYNLAEVDMLRVGKDGSQHEPLSPCKYT